MLHWETVLFLLLLVATLAYRMLTRKISLEGLLKDGPDASGVSPERVQLLLATLAVSGKFLGGTVHSAHGTMPDVSPQWLVIFGASGGVYATVKALKTLLRG